MKYDPLRSASRSKTRSVLFLGFLPDPVARQTIEHVSRAEAVFVELFTLAMGTELFLPVSTAAITIRRWSRG
jgi:hypothetical protein